MLTAFDDRQTALAFEPRGQALARQQLHHQVGLAGLGRIEVSHLHDVRMLQLRDDFSFAIKPRQRMGVFGQVLRQNLHCDASLQSHVLGFEHHAHAALIERA